MGTKVRILADTQVQGVDYKPNQVVDLPDDIAKSLVKEGVADSNKAAIAYCTTELKAEVVTHVVPKAEETPADPNGQQAQNS